MLKACTYTKNPRWSITVSPETEWGLGPAAQLVRVQAGYAPVVGVSEILLWFCSEAFACPGFLQLFSEKNYLRRKHT